MTQLYQVSQITILELKIDISFVVALESVQEPTFSFLIKKRSIRIRDCENMLNVGRIAGDEYCCVV